MPSALQQHNDVVLRVLRRYSCDVFKALGDGFCVAFDMPFDAVRAAIAIQEELSETEWFGRLKLEVKIGATTGVAQCAMGDYFGQAVNRAARLCSLAGAGGILISQSTHDLVAGYLDQEIGHQVLGLTKLKGMARPESVVQVFRLGNQPKLIQLDQTDETKVNNVPSRDRPFLGRSPELSDLRRLVVDDRLSLLTIYGFGGLGKTSLVQEFGRLVAEEFDHLVFVECDGLESWEAVSNATRSLAAEVREGQSLLVILDCIEHLAGREGGPDRVWLEFPSAQILMTSRILTGHRQESAYELKPFDTADQGEAVDLFIAYARLASATFEPGREDLQSIVEIVQLLEGVPLAIVLAASRIRILEPLELLEEMRANLFKTVRGPEAAYGKHADLGLVIDRSLGVLSLEDREVALDLCVFVGGFAISEARSVLRLGDDAVEVLERLRSNSLLVSYRSGGRQRLRLLDSVRAYFEVIVSRERVAALRTAHAQAYAEVAAAIRSLYESDQRQGGAERLLIELGNLRSGLQWLIESRQIELGVEFARHLARPLLEAGFHDEFEEVATFVEDSLQGEHVDLKVEILGLRGSLARRLGERELALRLWYEADQLCSGQGWTDRRADFLLDQADIARENGMLEVMRDSLSEFATLELSLVSESVLMSAEVLRSQVDVAAGQIELGADRAHRVADWVHRQPPSDALHYIALRLAEVFRTLGDYHLSHHMSSRLIQVGVQGHQPDAVCAGLLEIATNWLAQGDRVRAREVLDVAVMVPRGVSKRNQEALRELLHQTSDRAVVEASLVRQEETWDNLALSIATSHL
jgi:predicted ATPase